jgi:acyl-coenzyme A synthetase/AMP-(fatty) acid ligase
MMELLQLFNPTDTVIIQDDISLTAEEFSNASYKVAGYVAKNFPDSKVIGVRSDNSVYGLFLACGAGLAGKHVLPLSTLNDGTLNDYAIKNTGCTDFIGYDTDLDHSDVKNIFNLPDFETDATPGDYVFLSSGSTGKPKIHLNNLLQWDEGVPQARADLYFSKSITKSNKAFYAAPVMTGIGSYLAFMNIGLIPVYTAGPPATEAMLHLIDKYEVEASTGRPALLDRFAMYGVTDFGGVKTLVTAGDFLTEDNIKFVTEKMNIQNIVDCYNSSETGIIGVREALTEDEFTLMNDVVISDVTDIDFEIKSMSTAGMIIDSEIVRMTTKKVDDIVELNGNKLKLIGRSVKKVKVNGFSVSPSIIATAALQIAEINDCIVKVDTEKIDSSNVIVLNYTGEKCDDAYILESLKKRLPSYSLPKKINYIPVDSWGVVK